ncbi:hypothetical protein THAPSDRAFT_3570 [Thalassiosira pseudonana CCMP1335]|uniref:PPM-type phosphatase domain-containing protein n=1 Tax=Thalassiosira pseudonana TaxID=35128 RepID=B8BY58_THAPS|nr:hypothetical protein THAPSDRAFT_3570 [Thalassiosira pseudonana CCMP1335]EED93828.1 hypothetical protein THAPSDRAFT_3570 [Thalassiosira pseudonana CCMP1335]
MEDEYFVSEDGKFAAVCSSPPFSFMVIGSTSCAVFIHEHENASRTILSANVGDSRAVLGRNNGMAVNLTKDHKPNDATERKRVEALKGSVDWCGEVDESGSPIDDTGVYRINGNLALSRSIGDRSERPWVSNSVDISCFPIEEENDVFIVIATDGLFDVMTSQEVVSFVHDSLSNSERYNPQKSIAKILVEEAIERGSTDNISVVVIELGRRL